MDRLFSFNHTLARAVPRYGTTYSAEFNVEVSVYKKSWECVVEMQATETVFYLDTFDTPTGEKACFPGQIFQAVDDEVEQINEELARHYKAFREQLPVIVTIDGGEDEDRFRLAKSITPRPVSGADKYLIEPAPDFDFDQRPQPLKEAA